jgi:hypothetical protein
MENMNTIDPSVFRNIDTQINIERLIQQKEKEEAKKNGKRISK